MRDRVGFREIAVRGHDILLNGRSIRLRGIAVHEDDLALGRVTTETDLRRRFADARDLGCNFLRLAHYPHHERAAELADELGFLLWSEIPVYWAIDFANPATRTDAENQLRELILRDANRASVIVWGVGFRKDGGGGWSSVRWQARAVNPARPRRSCPAPAALAPAGRSQAR